MLISKQNPIRARPATKIRYFSDRLLEKMATAGSEAGFYQAKLQTARFYFERILPQAGSLWFAIKSGKDAMMSFNDGAF